MQEFCTSVAIMEKGRMVVSGKIDEVERPRDGRRRTWRSRCSTASTTFLRVVESDGRAGLVERKNGTAFEFRFDGGPDAAADLLATLVREGVRVSSFAPRRDGLEDLFLKVGAKEVS